MAKNLSELRVSRRQLLKGAAAAGGVTLLAACTSAAPPAATQAPVAAGAKPYAGTTVKLLMTQIDYGTGLSENLADLEQKTGIKGQVDMLAFQNLNQKADLELSTASGAYDVLQMIYIRTGRWIGAGWAEPLDSYINDPNLTDKAQFDVPDFVSGAIAPFTVGGKIYAFPWLADCTIVGYRKDLLEKAGYSKFPETFDDLQAAAAKIHTPDVAFFVTQNNMHWIYPNWMLSYGGKFFKNPPTDLTPMFNTPEAIKAADMFTTMCAKYGAPGCGSLEAAVAETIMHQGKAAVYLDGTGNVQQIIDTKRTQIADKFAFTQTPKGPAGHFPQLAVHGFLMNPAGKNKKAAWEFIKWAVSKETMLKMAMNYGHIATTRSSVLNNADVRKKYKWGDSDLTALEEGVMKQAGEGGYMAYRTVPSFPPVGDRLAQAITSVISGQSKVNDAMKSLQTDVIGILQKEGVKINP